MKIKLRSIQGVDLEGKVIVLYEEELSKSYRTLENRLCKATAGFGCKPDTIGRAIFATCLGDGEKARWDRSLVEGWLTEEALKLLELQKTLTEEEFLAWQEISIE